VRRMAAAIALAGLVAGVAGGCGGDGGARAPAVVPVPAAERPAIARTAQQLVAIRPAALGYRLRLAGARDEIRAQTDTTARTITLFLREGDPVNRVAHDLGHELGHAFDAERMTGADRAAYLARRGVPDAPWLPSGGGSDLASGSGDFAEVFALCAAASQDFRSTLAPRPEDPCQELPTTARRILTR
jgi:hypothetical protein